MLILGNMQVFPCNNASITIQKWDILSFGAWSGHEWDHHPLVLQCLGTLKGGP